nr:uncharacterized protein LOC113708268 [Coffea arabica]
MPDSVFNTLLDLLRQALPEGVNLPNSYYEAKKIMKELGLGYEKYDACPNDCTLYWGKDESKIKCDTCKHLRWERTKDDPTGEKRKVPHKVLWHFPLKPRLQRLFMSSKTASFMKWHVDGRTKDGRMRHPADTPVWQSFDYQNPEFAKDPRNVRLGLASDGFNPFKNMNVNHSTWPVVLMPYNLPPWMCMKQPYFMLSLLIPGPYAPGNNIDVYLQPLIAELKELWDIGVTTYDASSKENFQMHAALLWTISDFPGYANLSGWSTKGYLACPVCHKHTVSHHLRHGSKQCYMGHRRFLEKEHPYRKDKRHFDGKEEHGVAPPRLTGDMILEELRSYKIKFGKAVNDNPELPFNWKKQSIFFDLPYWKNNLLRHCLDVMHIEKNVCETIVRTLLNVDGKYDNLGVRRDLEEMGIRAGLHPITDEFGRAYLPPTCFYLDKKEKELFCKILKKVKVPDGYSATISKSVHLKPPKLTGLKSHDNHILLQQLLPLCYRKLLPKSVRSPLIKLSKYFRDLCCKALCPRELIRMEKEIAVVLCQLERVFPPSFFVIMVHLISHLATEARIAGPVHYRWMYPIERYLCTLKNYVRNRSRPEGSIAEGYLVDECLTFCSLYLSDEVITKFNRSSRNEDGGESSTKGLEIFSIQGRPLGKGNSVVMDDETIKKAHQYVIFNCEAMDPYINQHRKLVEEQHLRSSRHEKERIHSETFANWFDSHVDDFLPENEVISKDLRLLAKGPNVVGLKYERYIVNGFRFHTKNLESKRKNQNSGVIVTAITSSFASTKDMNPVSSDLAYYGVLKDILKLDYGGGRRVVLFDCDWVSKWKTLKQDDDGFTLVNFMNVKRHHEPFVLASQVKQVFYVEDPLDKGWNVVIPTVPRDDLKMDPIDVEMYLQSQPSSSHQSVIFDDINWVRQGVIGEIVDTTRVASSSKG